MAVTEQVTEREIVLTRTFDAPRDLVFEAWTNPVHVAKWWGPDGFTTTISEMDVRAGGEWRLVMHGPDGKDYHNHIVFIDVLRPSHLVYKHVPEKDTEPVSFETTVTFVEERGRTTVTMRSLFPSALALNHVVEKYGAIEGGKQHLASLAAHLATMDPRAASPEWDDEFVITRAFDAPRSLVFEAWTTPEHLRAWWGPDKFTLPQCDMDLRDGGAYRWVMRGPDGKDYGMQGFFREIVPNERLVFTSRLDHADPRTAIETTVTFADQGRGTSLTVSQKYFHMPEVNRRGAPVGWGQSLDRLAAHLSS